MTFVFRFGYETPEQSAANAAHGWDDEQSNYAVIESIDEGEALSWGRELAERFVRDLGGQSWRAGRFAQWVEPLSNCPWTDARPIVKVGEYPPPDYWT